MNTDFSQFNLHPELVQAVAERGYETPTPIQAQVIPVMLAGQDVIGQAQTGTGKTAAFALPMLHNLQSSSKKVQALVVTPVRVRAPPRVQVQPRPPPRVPLEALARVRAPVPARAPAEAPE